MEKASGTLNQFIIYAKNWYGKTDDPISDLKRIVAIQCGIYYNQVSERDVWHFLAEGADHVLRNTHPGRGTDFILEMLGQKWGPNDMLTRPAIAVILGNLSILKAEAMDISEKMKGFRVDIPLVYKNIYRCEACGQITWEEQYDSECDAECPECSAMASPLSSEVLVPVPEEMSDWRNVVTVEQEEVEA